jgi:hypothetical protein
MDVVRACASLLTNIGVSASWRTEPSSFRNNDPRIGLEELVHEMAHHVALLGRVDFVTAVSESICARISYLTAATRAGNEIDTLVIQLEAMWWLYYPHNQMQAAREALVNNFDIPMSARRLNTILSNLRSDPELSMLGAELALVIYEEMAKQERCPKDARRT